MTEQPPTEATPDKSEEILQRYLTWLGLEQLNVAHRLGAYVVNDIRGEKRGGGLTGKAKFTCPNVPAL